MALTEEEFGDVSEVTDEAAELGLAVLQYDDEPTEVADGAVDGGLLSDTVQGPHGSARSTAALRSCDDDARRSTNRSCTKLAVFSWIFRRVLSSRRNSTSSISLRSRLVCVGRAHPGWMRACHVRRRGGAYPTGLPRRWPRRMPSGNALS